MRKKDIPAEERTQERILDAAFDVLEEKTISGLRMALVAEKAGLFQSNIHYYFKSKYDLLLAVQKKVLQHCIDLRHTLSSESQSIDDQIETFWAQKKDFILNEPRYDYAEMEFWAQARIDEVIRKEVCRSFSNWRLEIEHMLDTFASNIPQQKRKLLAAVMVSMMEGATIQYLADPTSFSLDEYFDYCTTLVKKEILQ